MFSITRTTNIYPLGDTLMKKLLLPLALLCCTLTSAYSQDYGRHDRRGPDQDLRECQMKSEMLRRDNQSLTDRLSNCQNRDGDRGRVEQLKRENEELNTRNQFLMDQVSRLKIDVARLEMEAHPDRDGRFYLPDSIMACSKIDNAEYAQKCMTIAKANSIQANKIEQCSKFSNYYYDLECVKTISTREVSARQIEACHGISNDEYAVKCIALAGDKRISSDLIRTCVATGTNYYYQLECVKNM